MNRIETELRKYASEEDRLILQRFFKTGIGEYGEGDIFLGTRIPTIRQCVKRLSPFSDQEVDELIKSPIHECRMTALAYLVSEYEKAKKDIVKREYIYNYYLNNTRYVNNWDLVDLSAPTIVGIHSFNKDKKQLLELAESSNMWEQRIAMVSTWRLIRLGDLDTTFLIANKLLEHKHDLIHKAVGWMLREVGKVNYQKEYEYLTKNDLYKKIPRTMLRYAIEKFPDNIRKELMKK